MITITDASKCSGCHACLHVCPKQCITMEADGEGFWYPVVDTQACVDCQACERVCPISEPPKQVRLPEPEAYAAYVTSEDIRMKSSSGGLFTALSLYVLERGGVVFGAAFDEHFQVYHRMITSAQELDSVRGSKYVQSRIGQSYAQAKECLEEGRYVLFTGTPCQIAGLYSFLNRDYERLITHDIVCHGVSSPKVWESYLQFRKEQQAQTVTGVDFKDKATGWKTYSITMTFDKGGVYSCRSYRDPMMKAFIGNYCLRPSCHACSFKTMTRVSDFTLADFWGADRLLPHMDDNKGLSLVMLHSQKAQSVFAELPGIQYERADTSQAVVYNSSMIQSAAKAKQRDAFMQTVSADGFAKAAKRYLRDPLSVRLKRIMKKAVRLVKRQDTD